MKNYFEWEGKNGKGLINFDGVAGFREYNFKNDHTIEVYGNITLMGYFGNEIDCMAPIEVGIEFIKQYKQWIAEGFKNE